MSLRTTLPTPNMFETVGAGIAPSAFAVTDLVTRAIAAVGVELAGFMTATGLAAAPSVVVDQRLATLWGKYSFRPDGWEMPNLWDDLAGVYKTQDGWIRLHTNLPHHRSAALATLTCAPTRSAVSATLRRLSADAVERDIHAAGGVAAALRSPESWANHPQGQALAQEPSISWQRPRVVKARSLENATEQRPLKGLRVLDLTRVLAGPIATRALAGLGAEVLRIDPPGWDEPGVIPDIALGKSMATLDLKTPQGRARLSDLLAEADVLVHGYRPGALAALGFGPDALDALAPNRVEVTLNAYGWTGPWALRRGFDSLVQMSCGINHRGRAWANKTEPHPLPFQALDHATGYLMAAAVLSALTQAQTHAPIGTAHLSLARTALELTQLSPHATGPEILDWVDSDFTPAVEQTSWGPGHRLHSPLSVGQTQLKWTRPAVACGSHPASWPSAPAT
ncbi:acyl-CoA transferase [Epibacterium sp. SM1979]|uniref:Acyl-CoA transferase n=1 Tax=Tritonibacter litoralis TaxID=2662264 RepID=A0A843YHC9_9RHOB|nr:CoA transferase [Tritonibacter litoralis]MQQ09228.1 acyl-CoA transferase [Tritonibacter litoralis]